MSKLLIRSHRHNPKGISFETTETSLGLPHEINYTLLSLLLAVCVELDDLVNGGIDYGGGNDPFSLGTVAIYFCNIGYALIDGPDRKTCEESDDGTGIFNPPQTPTCDRK